MTDPILALPEVAVLLKVAEKTVYTMAQSTLILAFKVRDLWRFTRDDIEWWIDEQKAAVKGNAAKDCPNV